MAYFWINSNEEENEWKSTTKANLFVSNEYFFNNSNIILSQDSEFRDRLISNLSGEISIKPTIRHKQATKNKVKYKKIYRRIDIDSLNSSIRIGLNNDKNLLFELYNDDSVFYTSNGKKGFDFASIDKTYNLIQLWNLCFGRKSLHNGNEHWNNSLNQNQFLKETSNDFDFSSFIPGENIKIIKNSLTILGELQFGNWGLAYRDLFKVLHADANSGVDLFVYVTAHNNLLSLASDGIVSYEDTIKILNEFANLIKIPIWVIGIDIDI